MIFDGAAAEAAVLVGAAGRGGQRHGQMFPVEHVRADGVRPVHVAPDGGIRVVLEEHMIAVLPIDGAVGVVHPVGGGEQMILRAKHIGGQRGREVGRDG